MTRKQNLQALYDAVKAGTLPTFPVSYAALGESAHTADRAYHGSLDAALTLHRAVLPDWVVENLGNVCIDGTGGWNVRIVAHDYLETFCHGVGQSDTPARALLLAILAALIAQEGDQ
jgi:hypothetical protein